MFYRVEWLAWGKKGEAALNVKDCRLITRDEGSDFRGPMFYRLTPEQAIQAKVLFETTKNPRQDVYRFIDSNRLELVGA